MNYTIKNKNCQQLFFVCLKNKRVVSSLNDALTNTGTIKYNADDDYLYVKDGDNWVKWLKINIRTYPILVNNVSYFSFAAAWYSSSAHGSCTYSVDGSMLTITIQNASSSYDHYIRVATDTTFSTVGYKYLVFTARKDTTCTTQIGISKYGVGTTGNTSNGGCAIDSYIVPTGSWATYAIDLTDYPGNYYFKMIDNSRGGNGNVYIKDIYLSNSAE